MPQERNRFEPRDRLPIGGLIPGGSGGSSGGGSSGGSSGGSGFPSEGDRSPDYPNLVWKQGFWYDAKNDQYYDTSYQKIKGNPTISKPGPVDEGPFGPPGTLPSNAPDPGDGPVADGNAWLNGYDPYWKDHYPDATDYNQTSKGNPNIYINSPGMPGGSGGGGGLANPMPQMPGVTTKGVSPYQSWSQQSRRPAGQEAFKPYGNTMSYMSEALRYGGVPNLGLSGGADPLLLMAAQSAALRG